MTNNRDVYPVWFFNMVLISDKPYVMFPIIFAKLLK